MAVNDRRLFAERPAHTHDVRRARLPTRMPGLETLPAEFAAFPDGRHDDQVDAVCNVAANRKLVIRRARLWGQRLGRLQPIAPAVPPPPPKSRDQAAATPLLTDPDESEWEKYDGFR
jgi:hypothetical protein